MDYIHGLKSFSLIFYNKADAYNNLVVPPLRRMSHLEELTLYHNSNYQSTDNADFTGKQSDFNQTNFHWASNNIKFRLNGGRLKSTLSIGLRIGFCCTIIRLKSANIFHSDIHNKILTYVTHLHTFYFYINIENDINAWSLRLSNNDMQQTFTNRGNKQVACTVDHFVNSKALCQVFSLPG
ncbi:unnamed protein product [Rotaria socialis]|uniref:Uncharacterized protein n=1 Tax=Rotaria socialis TaxID=392032 RepID=A0A818UQ25_9BILA|nr:unnamed protein product [Rotaria socialis]CAF4881381.1 unnamed protein product [Rotaria socialis]